MPSISARFPLAATALIVGAWLSAASPFPALAADDGQAPIWMGIGAMVGLVPDKEETPIEYREHGKLVLPPKMELPQPGSAAIKNPEAWPVDPDLQKQVRAREAKKNAYFVPLSEKGHAKTTYGATEDNTPVTVRANAGVGPNTKPCTTGSNAKDCRSQGWSLFSTFGLSGQADNAPLGPEPDRDWLTDPPKGYRAPSAAGAAPAKTATK